MREAVRGIIWDGSKLLMVHSTQIGDYKFPGGGMEAGETHEATLRREVREECGAEIVEFGQPFGKIIEVDSAFEAEFDTFHMASYYYLCNVDGNFGAQKLDDYEEEMGYKPVWVSIEEALRANEMPVAAAPAGLPRWAAREAFVLGLVKAWAQTGTLPRDSKSSGRIAVASGRSPTRAKKEKS